MATANMCTRAVAIFRALSGPHSIRCATKSGKWSYCTATGVNSSKAKDDSATDKAPAADDLSERETELTAKLEDMVKANKELKDSVAELKDKYTRTLAEQQNLRDRFSKQVADAKQFGTQSFCKDLLEVADILGKATESVPQDLLTDENPHLKSLYEGLNMTEKQLMKVFEGNGLSVINPIDAKFDPNEHEALFEQVVEGKEPGTVALVTKVGYKLHNRVLRAALVGVVKR